MSAMTRKTDCPECDGWGEVEVDECTCGVGPSGYYGMHERYCGAEPCPAGCEYVPPTEREGTWSYGLEIH